jgi:hypothetical protein
MVSSGEFFLDEKGLENEIPDFGNKLGAIVRNDFGGKTMEFEAIGH